MKLSRVVKGPPTRMKKQQMTEKVQFKVREICLFSVLHCTMLWIPDFAAAVSNLANLASISSK